MPLEFVEGCNATIAGTMSAYSDRLKEMVNPTAEQCATAEFDISHTLLHDVILTEVRAYTMKFVAGMKRKDQLEKRILEERIDKIQNSDDVNKCKELEELKHK